MEEISSMDTGNKMEKTGKKIHRNVIKIRYITGAKSLLRYKLFILRVI
jgi:hypothetical protein